jgi:hypothetical protein
MIEPHSKVPVDEIGHTAHGFVAVAHGRSWPRLCKNVPGQKLLRIVFSVVPSQERLRVLVVFVSPKLRRKFYVPEESQSFHTAWALRVIPDPWLERSLSGE